MKHVVKGKTRPPRKNYHIVIKGENIEKSVVQTFTAKRHGQLTRIAGWFVPEKTYKPNTTGANQFISDFLGLDKYRDLLSKEPQKATYFLEAVNNIFLEATSAGREALARTMRSNPALVKKLLHAVFDKVSADVERQGVSLKQTIEKGKKIFVPASGRKKAYYRYDPREKSAEVVAEVAEPEQKYEAEVTPEEEVVEADPEKFIEARSKVPEPMQYYLSPYTKEEIAEKGIKIFMTKDGSAGVGITPDSDIVNLFSLKKGMGKAALEFAISHGGRKLDCFDGGLADYYKKFGFEEYHREPNWTPGGPDCVFMRRMANE